jgi:hypothetical protein
MWAAGEFYALPMPALPTDEPACSSLLKTPTAQLAVNGGSQHPDKRKAGGHGPTLADEVEHLLPTPTSRDGKGANQRGDSTCLHGALLPTPRATDGTKGGPNQRGSSGDLMLPSAVMLLPTPRATRGGSATETVYLLPTPSAADALGGHLSRSGDRSNELLLPGIAKQLAGATTPQPSNAGNDPSGGQPPLQLSWDDEDNG